MIKAYLEDRVWFSRHPQALVRFRPSRDHEVQALTKAGFPQPVFIPPGLSSSELPTWVAVVELTRVLAVPGSLDGASIRIRLFTVPIRSRTLQKRLAPLFLQAVVDDFLAEYSQLDRFHVA